MNCSKNKFSLLRPDFFIKLFFKTGADNGPYKSNVLWEGGYFLFTHASMSGHPMISRTKQ